MAVELSEKRAHSWLGSVVFALDRWLRRRQGSYEFSNRADCLFRVEVCIAEHFVVLSDGTCAQPGDSILRLHLWNEHVPRMGRDGPTVGWARQVSRALDSSLGELAQYLARRTELSGVRVLFGDMSLATARQTEQFTRIMARYGFEAAQCGHEQPRTLRRMGETILVLLLVLATNPIALRRGLRHHRRRIFLTRGALQARYGAQRRVRKSAPVNRGSAQGSAAG